MRLYKPEVFQGSLKRKNYFEGWYFKHISPDENQVYAFIPGISLSDDDPHAFIQVINGLTGESHYVSYPADQFTFEKKRLYVKVGESLFTDQFIDLKINDPGIKISGRLDYTGLSKYPKTLLAPGIMGWYAYVPFMECYHGVVSANHSIQGALKIQDSEINFSGGKGYIEKDWGTSFPECWIWLQSNSFQHDNASVFVSIAKIPWLGKFFIGFIAFLYLDGQYYKFATYNHSKISKLIKDGDKLEIELSNRKYKLNVHVSSQDAGELLAPQRGNMSRRIKESINSEVTVSLLDKNGQTIFKGASNRAGLEIIDKIFDYF